MAWKEAVINRHHAGFGMYQQEPWTEIDNPQIETWSEDIDILLDSLLRWNDHLSEWEFTDELNGRVYGQEGTIVKFTWKDGDTTYSAFIGDSALES